KRLPAKGRPIAIGDWLQCARSLTWFPDLSKPSLLQAHANSWWTWWIVCQPSWRVANLDRNGFRPSNGKGNWSSLRISGKNGLVLHIMALGWWGNAALNNVAEMEKWTDAVKEFTWALQKMH
ncbi:hypothetical protein BS47DRAFT_1304991, partial [Hydnum rufescens UP504]